MQTLEKTPSKGSAPSKAATTATVRIPAHTERLLKAFSVTPERFVGDIVKAVNSTSDLAQVLSDLYPQKGERGEILGLWIVAPE
jgi:hypothetical protein